MIKNIIIGVLALAVIFETSYIVVKKVATKVTTEITETSAKPVVAPAPQPSRPAPSFLTKGATLSASPIAKYAYLVAPGPLTPDAKSALIGWTIVSKAQADGSTVVTLTPKDSDDQFQSYTVKPTQKLYFVEMTPVDDIQNTDSDKNLRDDYGIIVDADGIVQ